VSEGERSSAMRNPENSDMNHRMQHIIRHETPMMYSGQTADFQI
jgi:hypothetical protein